jgi:hypothetical protein
MRINLDTHWRWSRRPRPGSMLVFCVCSGVEHPSVVMAALALQSFNLAVYK